RMFYRSFPTNYVGRSLGRVEGASKSGGILPSAARVPLAPAPLLPLTAGLSYRLSSGAVQVPLAAYGQHHLTIARENTSRCSIDASFSPQPWLPWLLFSFRNHLLPSGGRRSRQTNGTTRSRG